jgi:hypothetical protein
MSSITCRQQPCCHHHQNARRSMEATYRKDGLAVDYRDAIVELPQLKSPSPHRDDQPPHGDKARAT